MENSAPFLVNLKVVASVASLRMQMRGSKRQVPLSGLAVFGADEQKSASTRGVRPLGTCEFLPLFLSKLQLKCDVCKTQSHGHTHGL